MRPRIPRICAQNFSICQIIIRQDQLINFSRQRMDQSNTVIIKNFIVKFLRKVHFQKVLNLILPRRYQVWII